jgi:hypothetical protein
MKFFFNVILFMHVCFSFSFQQGLRFPGYSISLTLKKKILSPVRSFFFLCFVSLCFWVLYFSVSSFWLDCTVERGDF